MKSKLLLMITLFGIFVNLTRAESVNVQSLNQGTCWFSEEETSIKVVSFNDGQVMNLDDNYLSHILSLDLPLTFDGSYTAEIFCSSHGASLVMNIKEENLRYCLWLKLDSEGPKVQSFGLADNDSKCDGHDPGVLILSLNDDVNINDEFMRKLENREFGFEYESVSRVSERIIKVSFSKESYGREMEYASRFTDLDAVKFAEKSFFYHPIGEWGSLKSLKKD
ncbi:hypothetical protein A9Q84_02520 [Halobacteriovorax marinus]|uniref:Uncharacterized protein n=1 Tax=Halobacteriovorax marinus TaxID=97084 RepID=A0A1Y5FIB1_9BACT|nr:hypothetical protein A9Q84_02520 [Halobacteriovorax marinus]